MSRPVVLCVDDERIILESLKLELRNSLETNFRIEMADRGEDALDLVRQLVQENTEIVMVISDQRMPGMKGDQLLSSVHELSPRTLTILLTGFTDVEAIQNAVNNAGLYRYITKPWQRNDLAFTVREAVRSFVRIKLIEEQNLKIERLTLAMVSALENASLSYDSDTWAHVRRVSEYSGYISGAAGFDAAFVDRLRIYAPLHDIGKIGIPTELLNKPGRYTPEEFLRMQQHVLVGEKILDNENIDGMAKRIAAYHHEKWDGSGYAARLSGEDIPVEARLVAIADVFDALTTARPYKEAYSVDAALGIMTQGAGSHFDPRLFEVFVDNLPAILEVRNSILDPDDEPS